MCNALFMAIIHEHFSCSKLSLTHNVYFSAPKYSSLTPLRPPLLRLWHALAVLFWVMGLKSLCRNVHCPLLLGTSSHPYCTGTKLAKIAWSVSVYSVSKHIESSITWLKSPYPLSFTRFDWSKVYLNMEKRYAVVACLKMSEWNGSYLYQM